MALTSKDTKRLRIAGFIPEEIIRIGRAETPTGARQPVIDLNKDVWAKTIKNRMRQRERWAKKGLTEWQQDEVLRTYYRTKSSAPRSPYDFIKALYVPEKGLTDYAFAIRRRNQQRVRQGLGRAVKMVIEKRRR